MNWLNLHDSVLDSEEFIGASPIERGTWLCLQRYCIGQENGGRIENAREWKDRKWQQVVRVTLREVNTKCDLWEWDGDDLVVTFYPSDKEDEVRQRREIAKRNGNRGGRPKKSSDGTNDETHGKPTSVISEKAERKGIRKEGNGRECTPSKNEPSVEDCEAVACERLPAQKQFAASVARQFHALFSVKEWQTSSGENLLHKGKWKSRLLQMLEEEGRKAIARTGGKTTDEGRGW